MKRKAEIGVMHRSQGEVKGGERGWATFSSSSPQREATPCHPDLRLLAWRTEKQ